MFSYLALQFAIVLKKKIANYVCQTYPAVQASSPHAIKMVVNL